MAWPSYCLSSQSKETHSKESASPPPPTLIKQTLQEKGHHSSLFDDMLVFYDALTVLHFGDDGSPSFMEWYDPSYWDIASFIEETFPQSSPKQP